MENLRMAWQNAYYRTVTLYVCTIVTLIFGFQMYRYFVSLPADEITCVNVPTAIGLVPVIGVLLSG